MENEGEQEVGGEQGQVRIVGERKESVSRFFGLGGRKKIRPFEESLGPFVSI
jgi:hypothetical protein